jgi:hypothetical protein
MINEQNFELLRCPIGKGLKIDGGNNPISQEQLQHEVDYVRAQQILIAMLDCGLISLSEFNKITDLNRKTFSPLLAEIMA